MTRFLKWNRADSAFILAAITFARLTRNWTQPIEQPVAACGMASWRSGYAEDCKSLHPGSIPGEASKFSFYPVQMKR